MEFWRIWSMTAAYREREGKKTQYMLKSLPLYTGSLQPKEAFSQPQGHQDSMLGRLEITTG